MPYSIIALIYCCSLRSLWWAPLVPMADVSCFSSKINNSRIQNRKKTKKSRRVFSRFITRNWRKVTASLTCTNIAKAVFVFAFSKYSFGSISFDSILISDSFFTVIDISVFREAPEFRTALSDSQFFTVSPILPLPVKLIYDDSFRVNTISTAINLYGTA